MWNIRQPQPGPAWVPRPYPDPHSRAFLRAVQGSHLRQAMPTTTWATPQASPLLPVPGPFNGPTHMPRAPAPPPRRRGREETSTHYSSSPSSSTPTASTSASSAAASTSQLSAASSMEIDSIPGTFPESLRTLRHANARVEGITKKRAKPHSEPKPNLVPRKLQREDVVFIPAESDTPLRTPTPPPLTAWEEAVREFEAQPPRENADDDVALFRHILATMVNRAQERVYSEPAAIEEEEREMEKEDRERREEEERLEREREREKREREELTRLHQARFEELNVKRKEEEERMEREREQRRYEELTRLHQARFEELRREAQRRAEAQRRFVMEEQRRIEEERWRALQARMAEQYRRQLEEEERQRVEARLQAEQQANERQRRLEQFFKNYDEKWAFLRNPKNRAEDATSPIATTCLPWPVLGQVNSPSDITLDRVREFLEHPLRCGTEDKDMKARLRTELLRFHPDKFNQSALPWVQEDEKAAVKETAGLVTRYIYQLLSEKDG